jgi:hypothetical protein
MKDIKIDRRELVELVGFRIEKYKKVFLLKKNGAISINNLQYYEK